MINTGKLAGRTVFITGASRGIGKAIALKCAKDGANIVIAAKTAEAHSKLPGTIYTAAKEIEKSGGNALAVVCDIRDEKSIERAVQETVSKFGGIDILVNNASAIWLQPTEETNMKKYDLMHQINARGTYASTFTCLPHLRKSAQLGRNPHILTLSPPLNLNPLWFKNHVAYTNAKYAMSMFTLGWAHEFADVGIAANALWPRTAIATAAIEFIAGDEALRRSRKPEIMADAAYAILTKPSRTTTGNFFIDDEVLLAEGVKNLDKYSVIPGTKEFMPDFFLDETEPKSKL